MITSLIFETKPGRLLIGLAVALAVAGCAETADDGPTGVTVVATTSIWGDVASNVVGEHGVVEVMIPLGADAHEYQVSAGQLAEVAKSDLVVTNGLGLEEGLAATLDALAADGVEVIELGPGLDPMPLAGSESPDPHVWLDPIRAAEGARLIAAELERIAPGPDWTGRAERYAADLEQTDAEVENVIAAIPAGQRLLVTNHEALGYFAARYGLEVVGVVIPGGSTLADPSSAHLAELVATIESLKVPAIFAETTEPKRLAEAVAAETGRDVAVVELYVESLGPEDSGAATLSDLLLTDARAIADALS